MPHRIIASWIPRGHNLKGGLHPDHPLPAKNSVPRKTLHLMRWCELTHTERAFDYLWVDRLQCFWSTWVVILKHLRVQFLPRWEFWSNYGERGRAGEVCSWQWNQLLPCKSRHGLLSDSANVGRFCVFSLVPLFLLEFDIWVWCPAGELCGLTGSSAVEAGAKCSDRGDAKSGRGIRWLCRSLRHDGCWSWYGSAPIPKQRSRSSST